MIDTLLLMGAVNDGGKMRHFAPAGTPEPIIDKLANTAPKAMQTPKAQEALRKQGFEPLTAAQTSLPTTFAAKPPVGPQSRAPPDCGVSPSTESAIDAAEERRQRSLPY